MYKTVAILLLAVVLICNCTRDKNGRIYLRLTPANVELFAKGEISTNLYERDIAISPAGDEIIFTLSDYKQSQRCLVRILKNGRGWGKKEIVSFSGRYNDIEPFITVDGSELYFVSDRPVENDSTRKDYNIWVSERMGSGWGDPKPLPSNINSKNDEYYPSLSKNQNLYFTSVREFGRGSEDILISRYREGKFQDPELLDTTINTVADEFNAYINPEENLLIFSSYGRKDDLGGGDLYYSRKNKDDKWAEAINMGPSINSDKLDYCPFIDISRGNFYFTSERTMPTRKKIQSVSQVAEIANGVLNGMGNIYRVKFDSLYLK